MSFRKDFVWGSATASYQVEGAAFEDGKGLNIWDVFTHDGGHVYGNHTGDVACDQYHLFKEDVKMMKELGMKAYRFSLSWARIMPTGTGEINEKGIAYYNALIDELLANGIEPYITLYHWDLPYELYKQGGFLNPKIADWFYDYASLVAERFSDRVTHFFTLNEPQCIIGLGYLNGEQAPGLLTGKTDIFQMLYHLLRAHGKCVSALREKSVQPVKIGLASCGNTYYPASDSSEDIEAARYATFHMTNDSLHEAVWNFATVMDPIYKGEYPKELREYFGDVLVELTDEDKTLISQPLDFYGQNIYNSVEVKADENGKPVEVKRCDGFPETMMLWPVTPKGMYWAPRFIYERYQKPFYITENGLASMDWIHVDGTIKDYGRIDFLQRYLRELKKAAEDGSDIAGYFQWSLMDNFEWAFGYSKRFGLVYVDYETQKRTPKQSAYFYKEVIETNGECL